MFDAKRKIFWPPEARACTISILFPFLMFFADQISNTYDNTYRPIAKVTFWKVFALQI